jgi:LysM repeat protein
MVSSFSNCIQKPIFPVKNPLCRGYALPAITGCLLYAKIKNDIIAAMKQFSLLILFVIGLALIIIVSSAVTEPQPVQGALMYLTPTPDANGRIVYVVQAGDSCISIALKNSISLDDLRLLNNKAADDCVVYPGEELLLAIVEEPTPMPDQPTATPLFPTPTPFEGYAEVCIHLYEDENGNANRDDEIAEPLLANGAASITNPLESESWTGETVAFEPLCFSELSAGTYNISIAVPEGYNSTTANTAQVVMRAGDTTIVNFGAQRGSQVVGVTEEGDTSNTDAAANGKNPLLALIGGLMLVAGGGLGLYMAFTARRRQMHF